MRRVLLSGGFLCEQLFNTADNVLHSAELAEVLRLKSLEFVRQIVGIHIAEAGDQHLSPVLRSKAQEAAPFVLDPYRVEVLVRRSDGKHYLRRVQSGKNIGLVLSAELILQCNAGEEHLQTLGSQRVVNILRQYGIVGTHAVIVRFLIADENVIGLLVSADRKDRIVQAVDLLRLPPIDALCCYVGIFHGEYVVFVLHKALEARPVAGRLLFARGRVVDIFNAPIAQAQSPVSLGFLREFGDKLLVQCRRLVELIIKTQPVRAIEEGHLLLVISARHCLSRPAIFAFNDLVGFDDVQITTAHFAFKCCHIYPPIIFSLVSQGF